MVRLREARICVAPRMSVAVPLRQESRFCGHKEPLTAPGSPRGPGANWSCGASMGRCRAELGRCAPKHEGADDGPQRLGCLEELWPDGPPLDSLARHNAPEGTGSPIGASG